MLETWFASNIFHTSWLLVRLSTWLWRLWAVSTPQCVHSGCSRAYPCIHWRWSRAHKLFIQVDVRLDKRKNQRSGSPSFRTHGPISNGPRPTLWGPATTDEWIDRWWDDHPTAASAFVAPPPPPESCPLQGQSPLLRAHHPRRGSRRLRLPPNSLNPSSSSARHRHRDGAIDEEEERGVKGLRRPRWRWRRATARGRSSPPPSTGSSSTRSPAAATSHPGSSPRRSAPSARTKVAPEPTRRRSLFLCMEILVRGSNEGKLRFLWL